MRLWFVTAAHGRFAVTRLALTQRARLCAELAGQGIEARCVVMADDSNLDIAQEFGFDTLEVANSPLGAKVNAGIRYACIDGAADWVCWCGSDDWLHASLFDALEPTEERVVIAGRSITFVDLERPRIKRFPVVSNVGACPWIKSRTAVEHADYQPIVKPDRDRGLDGWLAIGMLGADFRSQDPCDHARVDFKSRESMTPYDQLVRFSDDLDPWCELESVYDGDLVDLARATHLELAGVAA